jgi:hypothetical protein
MGLPNVKNTILDGAMGVGGADSTGNFAVIGVAAIPSNGILTFVDPADVEKTIGDGPLRDVMVSALSIAKTTIYAIALEGTVAGTKSSVLSDEANTGSGTVTVSGNPRNEYDVLVEILSDGGLNEATFRVTLDGLAGKIITVPDDTGQYAIPNTGLTITFVPEDGFKAGDTFSTTAPAATNGAVSNLSGEKREMIRQADLALVDLKLLIRLGMLLGYLPLKKYEILIGYITEIGKMIGGWLKSVNQP